MTFEPSDLVLDVLEVSSVCVLFRCIMSVQIHSIYICILAHDWYMGTIVDIFIANQISAKG